MLEFLLSSEVLPWVLIIIGSLFLIIEAASPGFFMAVPGTALIVFGLISFFPYEIIPFPARLIIPIIAAVFAAALTILIYKKVSPDRKPTTRGKDNIVGKTGIVTSEVNAKDISGKVDVDGVSWSAKSADGIIQSGAEVEIIAADGVHLIVKEV